MRQLTIQKILFRAVHLNMGLALLVAISFFVMRTDYVKAQSEMPAEYFPIADTIVINAEIYTMDDESNSLTPGTVVEAMAVKDGKILGLGSNEEIQLLAGIETEVLDVDGRTVIPGLIDSHSHYMNRSGRSEYLEELGFEPQVPTWTVPLPDFTWEWPEDSWDRAWEWTVEAAQEVVREAVIEANPGEWIYVVIQGDSGISNLDCRIAYQEEGPWGGGRYNKQNMRLDEIAPNNPVHVRCGARPVLNTRAEEAYRAMWGDVPMEPGLIDAFDDNTGRASNTLNRVFRSDVMTPISALAGALQIINEEVGATGITTWSSMTRSAVQLNAYRLLEARGESAIRFAFGPSMGTLSMTTFETSHPDFTGYGGDFLWYMGISLRGVDGAYPDFATTLEPPQIRQEIKDREWLKPTNEWMDDIFAEGHRFTNTHMAGDYVVDLALDWLEETAEARGETAQDIRNRRHNFDHGRFRRPDQALRFVELGVIASFDSVYLYETTPRIAMDYGEIYTSWVTPFRTYIESGVTVANEISDATSRGAFWSLELMVTREANDGIVYGPEERIDRVLAMKVSTIWGAEYVLREDVLGSLEPGKWADFLVLNKPYFDVEQVSNHMIKTVRPLLTRVGNDTVYLDAELAREWNMEPVGRPSKEVLARIANWELQSGQ